MNLSPTLLLGRLVGSRAGGVSWLSALIGILLFAIFNLLLTLLLPGRFAHSTHAAVISDAIAALLAAVLAPFLLRTLDAMQRQVTRQNSELRSLHALDRAIGGTMNLQEILEIAVREATLAVDGEFGALWLLDPEAAWPKPTASAFYAVSPGMRIALTERLGAGATDLARRTGAAQRQTGLDETWKADRAAAGLQLRSALTLPITLGRPGTGQPNADGAGRAVLGLIQIGNRGGTLTPLDGFSPEDQALLESVAATVAVAVQNARLYRETLRRDEILRGLVARTGDAIAASSDAPLLMQILADEAARILSCRRVAIYAYALDLKQFTPLAAHDGGAARDETGRGRALLERFHAQPLALDADALPALPDSYAASAPAALGLSTEAAAFLNLPGYVFVLRSRDRRGIGLLCLLDPSPRLRQPDAAGFARALAAQASVALENAQLSRRTEELLERTQALQAAAGRMAAELDTDRVLEGVVGSARRVLDADGYALWDRAPETGAWSRRAAWGRQREDADEAALLLSVLSARAPGFGSPPDGPVRAQLALPLRYAGRATGVMALYSAAPRAFTPDEVGLAQSFADQAAGALENARLFSELQAAYQRERHIAGLFQESLLPVYAPRLGRFEFAHKYQAALEEAVIGGDFFDLFPLGAAPSGAARLGVVMADVSGKGLAAAVQTALLKYTLRGFASETPDAPAQVLARLNDVLCSPMSSHDGFVTLFYGVLDTGTGEIAYANAGHEPPLCRPGAAPGAGGAPVRPLPPCEGMVLGAVPGVAYDECRAVLAPGDLLLLYTDGLTEARAPDGSFLGLDGLCALLPPQDLSAQDAVQSVYARAADYADNVRRDDVAMLVLRRLPE